MNKFSRLCRLGATVVWVAALGSAQGNSDLSWEIGSGRDVGGSRMGVGHFAVLKNAAQKILDVEAPVLDKKDANKADSDDDDDEGTKIAGRRAPAVDKPIVAHGRGTAADDTKNEGTVPSAGTIIPGAEIQINDAAAVKEDKNAVAMPAEKEEAPFGLEEARKVTVRSMETAEFERPQLDDREYRFIEMTNGARFLLVSDPTSIGGNVRVSYDLTGWSDPIYTPGLQKLAQYSVTSAMKRRLNLLASKYVGAVDLTSGVGVSADVSSDGVEEMIAAIGREFEEKPTVDAKMIEEAVKVIDIKFKQRDESFSVEAAFHRTLDPADSRSFAFEGNRKSLEASGLPLVDQVKRFFSENLSAHMLSGVVISSQPIDVLHTLVAKAFKDLPKKTVPFAPATTPIIGPDQQGKMSWVDCDYDGITFYFALPYDGPDHVYALAQILNQNHEGSLIRVFDKMPQVDSMRAEVNSDGSPEVLTLVVDVRTVSSDPETLQLVGQKLFQAISAIRKADPSEFIARENEWSQLAFERTVWETRPPFRYGRSLHHRLALLSSPSTSPSASPSTVLKVHSMMKAYPDRAAWEKYVDSVVSVDKVRVHAYGSAWRESAKKYLAFTDSVRYDHGDIREDWRAAWTVALDEGHKDLTPEKIIREPTIVPTHGSIKPDDPEINREHVVQVELTDGEAAKKAKLFWQQSKENDAGIAMNIRLSTPLVQQTARSLAAAATYGAVVENAFRRYKPENDFRFYSSVDKFGGLNFEFSGSSDNFSQNVATVANVLGYPKVLTLDTLHDTTSSTSINQMDETIVSSFLTNLTMDADDLAATMLEHSFAKLMKNYNIALAEPDEVKASFKSAVGFQAPAEPSNALKESFVEVLVQGNVLKSEAIDLAEGIVKSFGIEKPSKPHSAPLPSVKLGTLKTASGKPMRLKLNGYSSPLNESSLNIVFGEEGDVETRAALELAQIPLRLNLRKFVANDGGTSLIGPGYAIASVSATAGQNVFRLSMQSPYAKEDMLAALVQFINSDVPAIDQTISSDNFEEYKAIWLKFSDSYLYDYPKSNFEKERFRLIHREDLTTDSPVVSAVKQLSLDRFKEIIKSYADKPWLAVESRMSEEPAAFPDKDGMPGKKDSIKWKDVSGGWKRKNVTFNVTGKPVDG